MEDDKMAKKLGVLIPSFVAKWEGNATKDSIFLWTIHGKIPLNPCQKRDLNLIPLN